MGAANPSCSSVPQPAGALGCISSHGSLLERSAVGVSPACYSFVNCGEVCLLNDIRKEREGEGRKDGKKLVLEN